MGRNLSKSRSPDLFLENSSKHSFDHNFSPILLKLCQYICFDHTLMIVLYCIGFNVASTVFQSLRDVQLITGGGRPRVPFLPDIYNRFQVEIRTRVEPPTIRKPAGRLPHMKDFRPVWGSNLQR